MAERASDAPVLVLAPFGRDGAMLETVLRAMAAPVRLCSDVREVCRALVTDAAALILTEEALAQDLERLADCLNAQPPWSDLPVLVLTTGGRTRMQARWRLFEALGNVTLLDRPVHPETLRSALRSMLRARDRQYGARQYLADLEQATLHLEERVADRTRALQREMAERERMEAALLRSQRMEAVGQLTGGIAHDFNNLLTAVLGSLELIKREAAGNARVQRFAGAAQQAAQRGAGLTSSLLAFSRRQTLQIQAMDANAALRDFAMLIRRTVGETVHVEYALSPSLRRCQADVSQFQAAVLNLVINARDAMPHGGTLLIGTADVVLTAAELEDNVEAVPGSFIAISVRDTGTGMTPDVLTRAFEPFFTTKDIGKGSGLGLSQVFGFARQSAGHVRIDTTLHRGTTVTLFLPAASDAVELPQIPASERPLALTGPACVLLVEDDPDVLSVVQTTLEQVGCTVQVARHGLEALQALEGGGEIDLLFSDVVMPGGISGIELGRRARLLRPGLPVLLTSGYAADALQRFQGAEDEFEIITKPYSPREVIERIQAMLRGRPIVSGQDV